MKKTMQTMIVVIVMLLGLGMYSCTTDPTLANIDLTVKAKTSLSTVASGRMESTGMEFTEARIGITEMEFESADEIEKEDSGDVEDNDGDGEDDNEDVEYEGNYVVDLLTGTSSPDFGVTDLAPGLYETIEFDAKPIMDDGNSLFIAFNYTPAGGSAAVAYEYSTMEEIEFEIENAAGFQIDEGGVSQILINLDLDSLFMNADLDLANADVDGVVRINKDSNIDLYNAIANSLDKAMEGGEDEDGDGEVDDD